jgi:hypothetical protein
MDVVAECQVPVSTTYPLLLTVNNVAPEVNTLSLMESTTPGTIGVGEVVTFNGTFADPGADAWRGEARIARAGGSTVIVPVVLQPDKSFTFSYAFDASADHTVEMTVFDDESGIPLSRSLMVEVANVLPEFDAQDVQDGMANAGQTFQRIVDFSDPDADTWTWSVDYGDGGGFTPFVSTGGLRQVSLNHVYTAGGDFVVKLRVSDQPGSADPVETSFVVHVVASLLGDYNRDDIVDAADYVVWRKTLGASVTAFAGADGSGNGLIDQDDFTIWMANFGNTSGSGGGGALQAAGMATAATRVSGPELITVTVDATGGGNETIEARAGGNTLAEHAGFSPAGSIELTPSVPETAVGSVAQPETMSFLATADIVGAGLAPVTTVLTATATPRNWMGSSYAEAARVRDEALGAYLESSKDSSLNRSPLRADLQQVARDIRQARVERNLRSAWPVERQATTQNGRRQALELLAGSGEYRATKRNCDENEVDHFETFVADDRSSDRFWGWDKEYSQAALEAVFDDNFGTE